MSWWEILIKVVLMAALTLVGGYAVFLLPLVPAIVWGVFMVWVLWLFERAWNLTWVITERSRNDHY